MRSKVPKRGRSDENSRDTPTFPRYEIIRGTPTKALCHTTIDTLSPEILKSTTRW